MSAAVWLKRAVVCWKSATFSFGWQAAALYDLIGKNRVLSAAASANHQIRVVLGIAKTAYIAAYRSIPCGMPALAQRLHADDEIPATQAAQFDSFIPIVRKPFTSATLRLYQPPLRPMLVRFENLRKLGNCYYSTEQPSTGTGSGYPHT